VPVDRPDTAIFLGAGASCSEGAPAQAQLFHQFFVEFSRRREGNLSSNKQIRLLRANLRRFFRDFFGLDLTRNVNKVNFPTFEEALGIVDLAINRDEAFLDFEPGRLSRDSDLGRIRRNLVFLIALILDEKLRNSSGHHRNLIYNLLQQRILKKCAFVSFNYDVLIDNALESFDHPDPRVPATAPDYAIELNSEFKTTQSPVISVPLLKLHGSLNWLYCSGCRSLSLTRYHKGALDTLLRPWNAQCARCKLLQVPIIIPPTYYKVLSNIFIQNVWHKAEQVLANCSTWVFCGYSFPDADMHVKYLLKRVQMASKSQLTVKVLNWHENKDTREAALKHDRYLRFLGKAPSFEYTKFSFLQFANNPKSVLGN